LNLRCPNCGAVFPDAATGGDAECPLCLHTFSAGGDAATVSGPSLKELENSETIALANPSQALPSDPNASGGNTVALGGQDPFAGGDPFASGGSDPFAAGADPFAAGTGDSFGGGGDPFDSGGSAPASGGDAGSGGGDVDFGALLGGATDSADSDPFGGGGGDSPFGESAAPAGGDNPFAAPAGGASDPFASGAQPAADPFAADDPFGGGGGGDPFGGGGDPFGGGDDPFGGGGDPFGGGDDPFGSSGDPFGGGETDTVVLPGGSGGGDSLFGDDDDEDSLFLATPSTSGAMFDEDEEESAGSFSGISAPVAAPVAAPPTPAAQQSSGGIGRVVAPLLLVAVGIVGADYMGYLDLGITKHLLPGLTGEKVKTKKVKVAANLLQPVPLDDSLGAYLQEVDRLDRVAKLSPQDKLVHAQLVDRLLDVYERFPTVFDNEPKYRKRLEGLQNKVGIPTRYGVLTLLAESKLDEVQPQLRALADSANASPDDYGVAALGMMDLFRMNRRRYVLKNPGEFSDAGVDPMALAQPEDKYLAHARKWLDKALAMAGKSVNKLKFDYYNARLRDMRGSWAANEKDIPTIVNAHPKHNRMRLLLASAHLASNKLGKAAALLGTASEQAIGSGNKSDLAIVYGIEARLEALRGRPEDQITAMQGVLKLRPGDELTTIRLGRLQLSQKHAQEAQALLVDGKKKGMKSIAFEVALVDFWLWSNRTEDALEEIKVATKLYPDTIELLYLRGQIEDRRQHYATARDFFSQVVKRRPKHLRAILRLAELQSQAGRHDDALLTLEAARKRLGEIAELLEPIADELYVLKRMREARAIYGKLLKMQPSNKKYLVKSARIDMDNGKVDRALLYMRRLRDDGNLDMNGALQMAEALVLKGKHGEAAKTIVPFAEREPNNVPLNTLAGKALLDSKQIDLAETFLNRAHGVAQRQGGNSETLFHYGRLAFKQGRIKQGIARLQLAIKADDGKPYYRYYLGSELMRIEMNKDPDKDPKGLGEVAVREMKWLVLHAPRFAKLGKPLAWLDDVQRQLGFHFIREKRFKDAIPHLQASVAINSRHKETLGKLGMALFRVNDDKARGVLEKLIKLDSKNAYAALYLGLIAQQRGQSTAALKWLRKAAVSTDAEVVEAYFQIALIHRDRRQLADARRWLKKFLRVAPKDHPFREEAEGILEDLSRG